MTNRWSWVLKLALLITLGGSSCSNADYAVHFAASLQPEETAARASIGISQTNANLRELKFQTGDGRYVDFTADKGSLEMDAGLVRWSVPKSGGTLSYTVKINHARRGGFDARITDDWALLRFEDLFPATTTRTRKGSESMSQVTIRAPEGWSVETRYGRMAEDPLPVTASDSRFDRPTGWLIAGKLGVRRDTISGREVVVAAPRESGYPRVPTLAFLRWTLPQLVSVFPNLPNSLLIVSGDDEMWRGALSGPASLYLHADRPLISENATSTLLHELVHVANRLSGKAGDDWIVEGLAEYYSLITLHRSGGISTERLGAAFQFLEDWATRDDGRLTSPSSGANTARATLLFRDLDEELAPVGGLDALVADLLPENPERATISRAQLEALANTRLGKPSKVLNAARVQ